MPTYKVTVQRSEWREHVFTEEAASEEDAREQAMNRAGDHDFGDDKVVDSDYEISNVEQLEPEDRLEPLFAAMEAHGNDQGTETQLGDAEEFLREAFERMSPEAQDQFLNSDTVKEFIDRELPDGEEE